MGRLYATIGCAAVAIYIAAAVPALPNEADQSAIRSVMMKTWDKPDSRLVVDPIVTAGDHAIAGWSQADMGGRALLRRRHHVWEVVLCAGDDLKKIDVIRTVGVPDPLAARLAADLSKAEAGVEPGRLLLFSRFEGLVLVNAESGAHPHGHQPHGPKH